MLDNTTELWMTKYIIGEIFSSGRATLYKNPSEQTVIYILSSIFFFDKITTGCEVLNHFVTNDWVWETQNMLKLRSDLEHADETSLQTFDFDIRSMDWKLFLENYMLGIRLFLLKNKPETLEASRKKLKLMKFLHYFVQCFFGFLFCYVLSSQLFTPV